MSIINTSVAAASLLGGAAMLAIVTPASAASLAPAIAQTADFAAIQKVTHDPLARPGNYYGGQYYGQPNYSRYGYYGGYRRSAPAVGFGLTVPRFGYGVGVPSFGYGYGYRQPYGYGYGYRGY